MHLILTADAVEFFKTLKQPFVKKLKLTVIAVIKIEKLIGVLL